METQESLRQIDNLRLRFQINNRLRLECLAALSRVFRENGESLSDELLSSLVLAVPDELPGERPPYLASTPPGGPPPGGPPAQPPPAQPTPGGPPPRPKSEIGRKRVAGERGGRTQRKKAS